MKIYVCALILSLLSISAFAEQKCRPMNSAGFDVDQFLNRIQQDESITSVESALCLIPESLRKNYVLIHSSQSAQSSRPEAPRAIIFKTTTKHQTHEIDFAISFNGSPSDTNFNNIEVLRTNQNPGPHQSHFEYIDVHFPEDRSHRVNISSPNPPQCLMCHGVYTDQARPIWDAKGFTPLAYGRSIFGGTIAHEPFIEQFKNLQANAPSDGRYKFLPGLDQIKVSDDEPRIPALEFANSLFGEALASRNNRRIIKFIKESPDFHKYKYALLATVSMCSNIPSYVPSELWPLHSDLAHVDESFHPPFNPAKIEAGFTLFNDMFGNNLSRPVSPEGIPEPLQPFWYDIEAKAVQWVATGGESLAALRWLMEGRGISMAEWAMDTPVGGRLSFYRFINARYSSDNQEILGQGLDNLNLMHHLVESDAILKSLYANIVGEGVGASLHKMREGHSDIKLIDRHTLYCDYLKQESLRTL